MSVQSRGDTLQNMACLHFAIIYIDRWGNLCYESSPSVADSEEPMLSFLMKDEFLQAIQRAVQPALPYPCCLSLPSFYRFFNDNVLTPSQLSHSRSKVNTGTYPKTSLGSRLSKQPVICSRPKGSWPWSRYSGQGHYSQSQHKLLGQTPTMKGSRNAFISIESREVLRKYYEKIFENLQQTNCRVLAKAYIKAVEPRKQMNFPYNGRKTVDGETLQLEPNDTKPPWWPSGVSHREPDHLPKVERIRLLVHIFSELRPVYGITARKLKEADQSVRRQISPTERLEILDEAYRVREEEEKFLDGLAEGKTVISISRQNLPDKAQRPVNCARRRHKLPPNDCLGPESRSEPTPTSGVSFGAKRQQTIIDSHIQSQSSPTQYVHQDLHLYNALDHDSPLSPPEMRITQQESGSDAITLTCPNTCWPPVITNMETPTSGQIGYPQISQPPNILFDEFMFESINEVSGPGTINYT